MDDEESVGRDDRRAVVQALAGFVADSRFGLDAPELRRNVLAVRFAIAGARPVEALMLSRRAR